MLKDSNVLVAGSGFIGTNLAKKLVAIGCKVSSTWHERRPTWPIDGVTYQQCDLTRLDQCEAVVQGKEFVFMCAGKTSGAALLEADPLSMLTPNVLMKTCA